jgi:hypothetical protein
VSSSRLTTRTRRQRSSSTTSSWTRWGGFENDLYYVVCLFVYDCLCVYLCVYLFCSIHNHCYRRLRCGAWTTRMRLMKRGIHPCINVDATHTLCTFMPCG